MAVLIAGLAVLMLPFQPRDSAEFIVTVMAAVVGLIFLGVVAWLARSVHPPLPRRADEQRKDYNKRFSRRGP